MTSSAMKLKANKQVDAIVAIVEECFDPQQQDLDQIRDMLDGFKSGTD